MLLVMILCATAVKSTPIRVGDLVELRRGACGSPARVIELLSHHRARVAILAVNGDDELRPGEFVTRLVETGIERKVDVASVMWVPWPEEILKLAADVQSRELDERRQSHPARDQSAAIWSKIVDIRELGLEPDWSEVW